MRCPKCTHENAAADSFCEECGVKLTPACPSCGRELKAAAKFCPKCGQSIGPSNSVSADSRTPDAERRQLTVMFCDLVGSTALSERLDPEDLREVVRPYQETCAGVIGRFDGYLAKYLGDGLLVYFGYPEAHEDDAERAVRAGLGIMDAMSSLNPQLEREHGVQLAVRVGIHTGLVVAGQMGASKQPEVRAIVGETPNVAARLEGIAAPDTVVISAATLRLVPGLFVTQDCGTSQLKGVTEPLRVYRVVQPSGVRSRLDVVERLTPFIGRQQELGLLLDRWEQAGEGRGQVVHISGEAGVGKSRLVQVLRRRLTETPHTWLECGCSPYAQGSAFLPVTTLLQQGLAFTEKDSTDDKFTKLERGLERAGLASPDAGPLLASLLSLPYRDRYPPLQMSPELQRRKTLETLVAWIAALSAHQPLLMLYEDLHWCDPSTLELLALAVEQVPTAPVLLLLTSRPEFEAPWPARSHHTPIGLRRLTRRQATAMVAKLTPGRALPDAVVEEIATRADGMPLFVEEVTKMALESGLLVERAGRYELTGSVEALAIPATLQDSLMARLDRLSAAKEVAQLGATLGREFSYQILRAVTPLDEPTLRRGLEQLVAAEVLYQRGLLPKASYTFKHALIQETAYQSLLKRTRQQTHARIAQALAARFPESVATEPEVIARHYEGAGLAAQAISFYRRAGERAAHRSANVEAIGHLTKGIELLKALPESPDRDQQELMLQVALGAPLMASKGYASPEVAQAFERARELCTGVAEAPQLFQAMYGLAVYYQNRSELESALLLTRPLLAPAERSGDTAILLSAHHVTGMPLYWQGNFTAAVKHLERTIALYVPDEHRSLAYVYGTDPGVEARCYAATAIWMLGYPERAVRWSLEAVELGRRNGHLFSLAFALGWGAMLHQMRREVGPVRERTEEAIRLSDKQGFPLWLGAGMVVGGWSLTKTGAMDQGLEQVQRGLAQLAETGTELGGPQILGGVADLYLGAGRPADALGTLEGALTIAETRGQHYWDAELYRLNGQIVLQQDGGANDPQADDLFRRSLEVARAQSAKSLELLAATSLARLWQKRGKKDEAHRLLSEIYGWFSEGFDTVPLKEAKALLDELS